MRYFLLAFPLLLFLSCAQKPSETFDLVIENGTLIDLETGELSQKHILISDGRIKKVISIGFHFRF